MGMGTISQFEHNVQPVSGSSETLKLGSSADVVIPANNMAANYVVNLPDGTAVGQRVHAICEGTAAGVGKTVLTLANAGLQLDGATALNTITFDAADEESYLEWQGLKWHLKDSVGATLA